MAKLPQWLGFFWFWLLVTLCSAENSARNYVKRDGTYYQDANTLLTSCSFSCGLDTCGSSCPVPLKKRWLLTGPSLLPGDEFSANQTFNQLQKRTFPIPGGRITTEKIRLTRPYIVGCTDNGAYDPLFNRLLGVAADTHMGTGSQQAAFSNIPFQWGTRFVHGCTMFTIVSKRGAYFAHIWEAYAFNSKDDMSSPYSNSDRPNDPDTGRDYGNLWSERALNALSGDGTIDANSAAISTPINWNLFNGPGDNVAVYIMTPRDDNNPQNPLYPNKIASLESMVQSKINNKARVVTYLYTKLTYATNGFGGPADPQPDPRLQPNTDKALNTEAGRALFQFDGAGTAPNQGNWRLWYENAYQYGTT